MNWTRMAVCAGLLVVANVHAAEPRATFLISDLHLGVGKDANGKWDNFEDFRWTSDFGPFLDEIDRQGQGKANLILNGDTFELWQSHDVPCTYPDFNLGCTESDALKRARRIVDQHGPDLRLIGAFAGKRDNRVVLVPGNHDVALLWATVRAELIAAMAAPSERVVFAERGTWRTADGAVYAEHGHQIGEDPNRFTGWPTPFASAADGGHTRRPWGEQFVQAFYNQFEMSYPIIDNLSSEAAGIRYATKVAGAPGTLRAVGHFLKFLILQESWRQFGQVLGGEPGQPPKWDLPAIRARKEQFLVESLATDDPLRALASAAVAAGQMDVSAADQQQLSDEEIRAICDARAAMQRSGKRVVTCPSTLGGGDYTLGAIMQSIFVRRDGLFRRHISGVGAPTPKVLVFSHTHKADKFDIKHPDVHVLNTGAWQRLVTPERLESLAKSRQVVSAAEAFRHFTPDDLDACYTYVSIPAYSAEPTPHLMSWQKLASGTWTALERPCPQN